MGPLEILWFAIFIFFILIALARGYSKELGVTTMIFVALFVITYILQPSLPRLLNSLDQRLDFISISQREMDHIMSLTLSLTLIGITFASYAGNTFQFRGTERSGFAGGAISFLVGVVEGYLIAGTLWYLQDYYHYPMADWTNAAGHAIFLELPLSKLAETLAAYMPPYIVPDLMWAFFVMIMLLLRVRR